MCESRGNVKAGRGGLLLSFDRGSYPFSGHLEDCWRAQIAYVAITMVCNRALKLKNQLRV